MQLLQCITTVTGSKTEYFRLMDHLGPFWKKLATGLGCPDYMIRMIGKKDDDERVYAIFSDWLRGAFENDQLITWGTLVTVLHKAGVTDVAQTLENHLDKIIE